MNKPQLHGDHFYKFFQCPHWIWYDIYGDMTKKKAMPPLLDLIYKGKALSKNSVSNHKKFEEIKPELFKDIEEAFLATLELMRKGKNIYHGVLMNEDWVGIPDLLEARPGKSNFGDWHYVVYDIQNSLELRDENKFQLIFYSLILERLQGVRPEKAYVIDADGNERSFVVDDFVKDFHLTREQIQKILNGEKPAPFLKSGCKRTPWYTLCLEETKGCNDVSLIFKLSQADQRRLYEIGIRTVEDMAKADVDNLQSQLEDWPFDKLVRINNQAKVLMSNEPMVLRQTVFPEVKTEIYFDIESDPTSDTDYLLGFLVKNNGKSEYNYLLAKDNSEEKEVWTKFLDFLAKLDDFVIYHYAYYERQVFDRLALKYGAPSELMNKFRDNTIDLHAKLIDSIVLPLYFYSLKDVAGYLGYKWADPGAGGAESVVWYSNWLDKKDTKILDKLLKYNEDDVRATLTIKEWLEKQKPRTSRERLD
ncbi:MAG: hypothetical protein A3J46_06440 [Candidatus Yanofskybacteria bacterium RIFCSPHIGHO2_02_FULL_41_11]|uniref:YprB ribonuclease H-like domain-containing protein n=1 Tax=Candidatus Yanofskybacteria bacterium RIFCSPHIGHO2_02_FULL_41_11 TaxID=1802675 RepID=A0A1F8FBG7_9BACT|nr:MAG: hypothetical protein A3J46_06440 [Candidatus Yanofskybacteria bacterium RIFCSPHIGHO2_02_FULL_41_11]